MQQHINLLGKTVIDKVTGFKGVVTSVCFDLYGCIQAIITPPFKEGSEKQNLGWFDIGRLEIVNNDRVMDIPAFNIPGPVAEGQKGPAEKPVK